MTVAVCGPSISVSLTTVTWNVADVCPARMVTVAGTVNSLVSVELNCTTTSAAGAWLTETIPAPLSRPSPSVAPAGRLTVSTAVSLSWTVKLALPARQSAAVAVIVVACEPSNSVSSSTVMSNEANVCPAGIVTVAGTVAWRVSLDWRLTIRSAPHADGDRHAPLAGQDCVAFAGGGRHGHR